MDKKILKELSILFTFVIIIVGFSGCVYRAGDKNINVEQKISEKDIVIGVGGLISGFYPWIESYEVSTMSINSNIFNCLVEFDNTLRITPGLAHTWNNPDNLTWRFFLRENVKFHNGYNFTAEDVKYSIELITKDENSVLRGLLPSVEDLIIVDDYTVDIKTKKPCPILLNRLVNVFIVSKQYQEEATSKWPIGTGGYKLASYFPEYHIILERFDDYWKKPLEITSVEYRVISNDEERKNALISKKIHINRYLLSDYFDEINKTEEVDVKIVTTPSVRYLGFDFRENNSHCFQDEKNPVSNIKVRKAIYHAINIDEIIQDCFNGFAQPASQFVSPNIFGYNPSINRLEYNLEMAKQLMKEAGYEDGFSIGLDCPDNNISKRICNKISEQLSEINIDVKIINLSVCEYFEKIDMCNTSFYIMGWLPDTADGGEIFDFMLRTTDYNEGIGMCNYGFYSNPEVDIIGEKVSFCIDHEERLFLMQEGFSIAMEDIVWVPLYMSNYLMGFHKSVDWNPRPDLTIKIEDIKFNK